jgi:hypothetical protein
MMGRLVFAVILLAALSPACADDLQTIIAKYIAWRGGAAFESMQSIHEKGEIRLGGLHGTFEQWLARDGRLRRNGTLGRITSAEASTPDAGWTTNASGQIEDLADGGEGDRRGVFLAFAGEVERHGASYSLLAPEQRDGRVWDVVRVGFTGHDTYDLFLAPETGELLGERITEDRRTRFVRYADWRMVTGVRIAFDEQETGTNEADHQYQHVAAIEINVPTPAHLFVRPAARKTWSFASGHHSTGWIEFEFFHDNEIFIPATINHRAVELLLDSGAGISVLDSGFARRIGVKSSGTLPVSGSGGQATMQLAPEVQIRLGGLTLRRITAGVIDLSEVGAQLGHPMPLILGREVFNQLIIDIDFSHHEIAFRDPGGFSSPGDAVRVALGRHNTHRSIPVSVEGGTPVPFDFDLGNNGPLIVYSSYRDSTHLLDNKRQSLDLGAGVGGTFKSKVATLESITIAGIRIADIPTQFPDAADNAVNSDRTAGNIGLPVFSRFRLITDYPHDALWLIADAKVLAEPFAKDRSGLVTERAADRLKVLMVAPGSPAENAGWQEGAEIVAVDGRKIDASYSGSPLSQWSQQRSGTVVILTLADGSTRQLTLADYY